MLDAIIRWGGVLVAPRATLRETPRDEGRWDGVMLAIVYVLATQMVRLAEAVSGWMATRDMGGILILLQGLGRGLLPPVLVVLAVETLLGDDRAFRRGIFLAPLVLMGSVAGILRGVGVVLPGPSFLPELVGAAWGVALAVIMREAIPADAAEAKT